MMPKNSINSFWQSSLVTKTSNYLDFPKLIPHSILIDTLPPDDEIVGSLSVVGLLLGGK